MGQTNYLTLVDDIVQFHGKETMLLVTFNYDNLLEQALQTYFRKQITTISDYIAGPRYKLFKLHGSLNWARRIGVPLALRDSIEKTGHQDLSVNELIEVIDSVTLENKYELIGAVPTWQTPIPHVLALPAIAIPLVTKNDFECPVEHEAELDKLLPSVSKIVIVGWRAGEMRFVTKLKNVLTPAVNVIVIDENVDEAIKVIDALRSSNVHATFTAADDNGFTRALMGTQLEKFLSTRSAAKA